MAQQEIRLLNQIYFSRLLITDLILNNTESLVLVEYIDLDTYDIELNGDADLEIL